MPREPMVDLLDLPLYQGQVSRTFRWELFNGATGASKGAITPLRAPAPALQHDATSTISRRITNLVLGVDDAARIDVVTDRISVSMVLGDSAETEYPLGVYLCADDVRAVSTAGNMGAITLFDEMFIVDQQMETAFDGGNERVDTAILRLLEGLPIGDVLIEATDQVTVNSWAAGTMRGRILMELATLGGYFKPWFDHSGRMRVVRAFEPADRVPDIDLDEPPRVERDSIGRSSDLLTAPNRFVVISNNDAVQDGSVPVVGVYNVPSSAPHSIARRGFVIPEVMEAQVASEAQASVYARAVGIQATAFERVQLNTPPDPRHDSYDVIRWDGEQWLEIGWAMSLSATGTMSHTLRRAFPGTGEDEELL